MPCAGQPEGYAKSGSKIDFSGQNKGDGSLFIGISPGVLDLRLGVIETGGSTEGEYHWR
jgi:hypothetical protein